MVNRLIIKTLLYRISASALTQIITYLLYHKTEYNLCVLLADLTQTIYYYTYEKLWHKTQ